MTDTDKNLNSSVTICLSTLVTIEKTIDRIGQVAPVRLERANCDATSFRETFIPLLCYKQSLERVSAF